METIHVKAQLSYDELLKAVEQLKLPELERFVSRVISLCAKKKGESFSKNETELLLKINRQIDPIIQKRYDELISKRQRETLISEEYEELLKLTDQIEKLEAERVKYLSQLAQLRRTPVSKLMKELGIHTPAYV